MPDSNSEGEKRYIPKKVTVQFKDTNLNSMSQYINLNQNRLRRSKRLKKKQPTYNNGDLVYNLFTNFSNQHGKDKYKKLIFQERILYMQEYINVLIDKSLNFVNEMVISIVNNEVYYLKEILKQDDKLDFI